MRICSPLFTTKKPILIAVSKAATQYMNIKRPARGFIWCLCSRYRLEDPSMQSVRSFLEMVYVKKKSVRRQKKKKNKKRMKQRKSNHVMCQKILKQRLLLKNFFLKGLNVVKVNQASNILGRPQKLSNHGPQRNVAVAVAMATCAGEANNWRS